MIVCAVDKNRESHESVERRTDFSLRERKLEMAGWRERVRRRRKRWETTPGGRHAWVRGPGLWRKRASQAWIVRERRRRGNSWTLSLIQEQSQGGMIMYFVPRIKWM